MRVAAGHFPQTKGSRHEPGQPLDCQLPPPDRASRGSAAHLACFPSLSTADRLTAGVFWPAHTALMSRSRSRRRDPGPLPAVPIPVEITPSSCMQRIYRPCWTCTYFDGMASSGISALCAHPGCCRERSTPENGCCHWMREPGSDDEVLTAEQMEEASTHLASRWPPPSLGRREAFSTPTAAPARRRPTAPPVLREPSPPRS